MNHLPSFRGPTEAAAFIVNTASASEKGEHWVAVYLPSLSSPSEYFDSFGVLPFHENILRLLGGSGAGNYKYNSFQFQSPCSNACGHYCLFFLCHRLKGDSFESILQSLLSTSDPDKLVVEFVREHFNNLPPPSYPLINKACTNQQEKRSSEADLSYDSTFNE